MKPKVKAPEQSGAFALHSDALGLVHVRAFPFAKQMKANAGNKPVSSTLSSVAFLQPIDKRTVFVGMSGHF
jgi:hypothetical protein